jgi:hypothetical protein
MENTFPFKRILAVRGLDKNLRVNPLDCPHKHTVEGFQKVPAGSNFLITKIQFCTDCHFVLQSTPTLTNPQAKQASGK